MTKKIAVLIIATFFTACSDGEKTIESAKLVYPITKKTDTASTSYVVVEATTTRTNKNRRLLNNNAQSGERERDNI